jgi:hypothetical protein
MNSEKVLFGCYIWYLITDIRYLSFWDEFYRLFLNFKGKEAQKMTRRSLSGSDRSRKLKSLVVFNGILDSNAPQLIYSNVFKLNLINVDCNLKFFAWPRTSVKTRAFSTESWISYVLKDISRSSAAMQA